MTLLENGGDEAQKMFDKYPLRHVWDNWFIC